MTTSIAAVPERLRVDFDPFDPRLCEPVDHFQERVAELAKIGPVLYSTAHGGYWVVTGYPEIHQVMRDPATFSSWPNNIVPHGAGRFLPLELDPPDHTALRHALQPLFNPARMKKLEPEIRAIVNELIDGFAAKGHAEFISEFAHELPTRVFLALMGWPLEDAALFTECTDTTLLGKPGASEEESNAARMDAAARLTEYFLDVIRDRRARPEDSADVTTVIVNTEVELEGETRLLTEQELGNLFHLLAIAGLHTTQGSLAWGLTYLAAQPEQRQRLLDNPAMVPSVVEEVLRIEAAVSPGRKAVRDTELGGVRVKAGDQLLCVLAGANRDEREFSKPTEMIVDRTPNRHLSFGAGPHRCIGSHLARVELAIAFEELHRRIPDYRLDPEEQTISHPSQTRGVIRMPIRFSPEESAG
ncbi:MAG TPA: cytochrome P450 [Pseudonocardia sp.]